MRRTSKSAARSNGFTVDGLTVDGLTARKASHLAVAAAAGLMAITAVPHAVHADYVWQGGTNDFYTNNWNNSGTLNSAAPNGSTGAFNAEVNTGLVTISPTTAAINVFDFRAGDTAASNGAYQQSGSVATVNSWLRLGDGAAATGTYTLTGGLLATKSNNNIAEAANSYGLFNLGGTGTWNVSGAFLGFGGAGGAKGYLNQSGGSLNVTGASPVELGYASGSTATVNVTAGSISLSNAANNAFDVGAVAGASGLMNVTGTGVVSTTASEFWVGNAGSGILNVNSGGAINVGNWIAIGRSAGTGTVNLGTGGTITKTTPGTYVLSTNATTGNLVTFAGTTNVLNQTGGTFNASTSAMFLGENGATTSTWNLVGGIGTVAQVVFGRNANAVGNLNLSGGTLQVNQIFKGAGIGNLYFNGGTLQAFSAANGSSFMTGLTSATVNGNSTIDNNGFNITIAQAMTHSALAGATDGGLNFNGSGSTTIAALMTYTGTTTLNAAALNMSSTGAAGFAGPVTGAAPINIVTGVGGFGSDANSYTGTLNVASGATLMLGTGGTSGSLSPASTLQFTSGANLAFNRSDSFPYATGSGDLVPSAPFTGTGALIQAGTGTLTVGNQNTLTGGAKITNTGTLNMTTGSITGPIALSGGGTLMFAAGNTTDVTTVNTLSLNAGGGHVNTNGMNLIFNGNVAGANLGPFYKSGPGNLTMTGTISPTQVFVNGGTLAFAGPGSSVTANSYTSVGLVGGDNGTMNVSGGAKFTNGTQDFNVADVAGTPAAPNVGVVNISDDTASGTNVSTGILYIGKGSSGNGNAIGTLNMTGGLYNQNNNAQIGVYGTGTFNLSGGTYNSSGFVSVGRYPGALGTLNMTGGNLTALGQPYFIVGEQGTGVMTMSNGILTVKTLSLGHSSGLAANGTFTQTGGTVNASTGGLSFGTVGGSATAPVVGLYNLAGGVLMVTGVTQTANVANAITGTLDLNGGTLQAVASNTAFFGPVSAINVGANGFTFNNAGYSLTLSHVLAHDPSLGAALDGGMTEIGTGTISLVAADTYTGPTVVQMGTLAGTGSVAGSMTVLSVLAPGNGSAGSVGTFTAGPTTFNGTSTYAVDLSGATSDRLAVNGNLTLIGSSDAITFNGTPDGTSTYTVATYTGTESGTFTPTNLPAGYALTYGGGAVQLTPVSMVPEPASFGLLGLAALGLVRRRRHAN